MITIKDGIHGHIDVEGVARDLLDTPVVQRLRRLKQLGTTSLVYPSANHSRFEHSLGVYYLASQVVDELDIDGYKADCICAAALLHDIGHGPFSHNTEPLLEWYLDKSHDDVSGLLSSGEVNEVLTAHDIDDHHVAGLIAGDGKYGQIISSELDVDRMDYLARDAHHAGVPYGTIDHERLIMSFSFDEGTLAVSNSEIQVAESMLTSRALMNPTVYHHHGARISELMLVRAAEKLIEDDVIEPEELRRMDDHDLIVSLRQHSTTKDLVKRIDNRDMYKRAVWVGLDAVTRELLDADHETVLEYEQAIAEEAGIKYDEVIVEIPDPPSIPESDTKIIENGESMPLRERSSIIGALESANQNQWRLGVYTPDESIDSVKQAADNILDLNSDGELVKERKDNYNSIDENSS